MGHLCACGRLEMESKLACKACGSFEMVVKKDVFRNGDTHDRVECASCGAFVKFGKPRAKSRGPIAYPGQSSEFEVQAWMYSEIKGMGIDVRGEVPCGNGVLDLVLFDNCRHPVLVLEVKRLRVEQLARVQKAQSVRKRVRSQLVRYRSHGIPVLLVDGIKKARKVIAELKQDSLAMVAHRVGLRH